MTLPKLVGGFVHVENSGQVKLLLMHEEVLYALLGFVGGNVREYHENKGKLYVKVNLGLDFSHFSLFPQ